MDYFVSVESHYTRSNLTQRWDDYFGFRSQPVGELCLKYLQLQPDDLLVDVGAGNGNTTEPLWKKGILKNPILCVDPSAEMLRGCESREGLVPLRASALEFFRDESKFRHNKVLLCQNMHIMSDLQETFDAMFKNSPPNFMCVIVAYAPRVKMAFWKTAKERFEEAVKRGGPEVVTKALTNAGFKLNITDELIVYTPTKAEWYRNLRNRSFVALESFSDAEIEEGLRELDRDYFPGAANSDRVEVVDNVAVIVATKE